MVPQLDIGQFYSDQRFPSAYQHDSWPLLNVLSSVLSVAVGDVFGDSRTCLAIALFASRRLLPPSGAPRGHIWQCIPRSKVCVCVCVISVQAISALLTLSCLMILFPLYIMVSVMSWKVFGRKFPIMCLMTQKESVERYTPTISKTLVEINKWLFFRKKL